MFLLQNWVNNIVKTDLVLFVLIKILFLSCVFFVSICCAFSIKNFKSINCFFNSGDRLGCSNARFS